MPSKAWTRLKSSACNRAGFRMFSDSARAIQRRHTTRPVDMTYAHCFFKPATGIFNVLYSLNPQFYDQGVLNQALPLHEALHGYAKEDDNGLVSAFGLPPRIG